MLSIANVIEGGIRNASEIGIQHILPIVELTIFRRKNEKLEEKKFEENYQRFFRNLSTNNDVVHE